MGPPTIRVLIVDDHSVVREALSAFLDQEPDLEVIGTAQSGEEAVTLAAASVPHVVLMDLSMPGIGGIEATRRIVDANPKVRVVMLTSFGGTDRMVDALKNGAVGYVIKDSAPSELLKALRTVATLSQPDPTAA